MRKSLIIVVVALSLSACGFKPLYAKRDNHTLSNVKVVNSFGDGMPKRVRFHINHELESRFASNQNSEFVLDTEFSHEVYNAALRTDSTVVRKNIIVKASYKLFKPGEQGRVIDSGSIGLLDSYNTSNSPYSDYISEEEIVLRVAKAVINDLQLRILGKINQSG
jgi:hypothetical protein